MTEEKTKKREHEEPETESGREVSARARYIRTAPRKIRLVLDAIRGKRVDKARAILKFSGKRAAEPIMKLLNSAIANAENNFLMDIDSLYIHSAFVDQGPTMKRWTPRAMGRASQIHKRTSHITIVVKEKEANE